MRIYMCKKEDGVRGSGSVRGSKWTMGGYVFRRCWTAYMYRDEDEEVRARTQRGRYQWKVWDRWVEPHRPGKRVGSWLRVACIRKGHKPWPFRAAQQERGRPGSGSVGMYCTVAVHLNLARHHLQTRKLDLG